MKHLFISYKRADLTTPVARALNARALMSLPKHGFAKPFFDKDSIEAGQQWSPAIDTALDESTHFIALLSVDYWGSEQCQRELKGAVQRHEVGGRPLLLFVLTEKMDPNDLEMAADDRSAMLKRKFPAVQNLGQINFLGPYDRAGRLVRLACENPAALSDQLSDLIDDIKRLA